MPVVNPGIRRLLASAIQRLFNGASFSAPLTHSAIPTRAASGTTATFTRATTATVKDHEGVLRTAIAGEARFDGARRVRNLIPSSESFAAGWVAPGASSVSANAILSPIGTLTADALIEDGTTAYHRINHASVSRTSGQVIAVSVYAKYAGRNLFMNWNSFCNATGAFNLQTGEVTQGAGVASIEALDGGWYRCTVIGTCTATGADNGYLQLTPTNVSGSYAGDGVSGAYFWGVQIEDVTAQTTQTAGEYVSVGVESAPYYHGSFVDGVKCFPTDLSGNPLPTTYTYDAVSLNGVAGTYVSTPDSVASSITGDIDIRVKAAPAGWTGAGVQHLVSKRNNATGASEAYAFAIQGSGVLSFYHNNGVTQTIPVSTVGTGYSAGTTHWVRVTWKQSSGDVKFYTSEDGDSWTQLGTTVAGPTTALNDGTRSIALGQNPNSTEVTFSGSIYRAQIYNGINGTLAVDFNASRYAGGTTLTGSTGETWTLQGNAVIHPTNSPMLGYQAEGARTNFCLQSQTFDNASWVSAGLSTIAQNSTGPDGAISAWTLTDTNGVIAGYINQTIPTNLTAAPHTAAVYVGKTSGVLSGYPTIEIYTGAGSLISVFTLDTTNGIATPWTSYTGFTLVAQSAICKNYNEDFWRFEITFLATAATWLLSILPAGASSATFAGPAPEVTVQGSAVFYGAQVELGSFASSYIPTTTAAVTRNADVLTYSGAGNIDGTKGWCYAELSLYSATVAATQIAIGTTTANALLYDGAGNATTIIQSYDGTTVVSKGGLTDMSTGVRKRSVSWGGSATTLTGDGATPATGAFDGDMGITAIGVGCFTNGANSWFGTIRNVRLGQRQLSASELQAVTA